MKTTLTGQIILFLLILFEDKMTTYINGVANLKSFKLNEFMILKIWSDAKRTKKSKKKI